MLKRTLVAYSMTSTHVQTTMDYLVALKHYLGGEVEYVHVTHDAYLDFDLSRYDVVFHNYCARLCFPGYVSDSYRRAMRAFKGLKILAVQDEYDNTDVLKSAIRDLGFQVVLTCVPQGSLEYVYPRRDFPGVEFVTVFTGYVPDGFAELHASTKPLEERSIFLGYRGRDIGGSYGRLGFEKYEVGRRMREECVKRGIPCDIAMDEASRIYGNKWFDFIGDCRAMLGSESGSNVFDFDGSIKARFDEMTKAKGAPPSWAEFLPTIAERDSQIDMGQISPRIFECAVIRTPMVLIRGGYSGAITPDTHYIALERDFSNAGEVLDRLRDTRALAAMADRAYDHLVASGTFGYSAYVASLRSIVDRHLATMAQRPAVVAQRRAAAGSREAVLTEAPSDLPRGMADFRRKQGLLNGDYYAGSARHLRRTLVPAASTYETLVDQLEHRSGLVFEGSGQCAAVSELSALLGEARSKIDTIKTMANAYDEQRQELERHRATVDPNNHDAIERAGFDIAECDRQWIETVTTVYGQLSEQVSSAQSLGRDLAAARRGELDMRTKLQLALSDARFVLSRPKIELVRSAARRIPIVRDVARTVLRHLGQCR